VRLYSIAIIEMADFRRGAYHVGIVAQTFSAEICHRRHGIARSI
jgi:hypothetical protein